MATTSSTGTLQSTIRLAHCCGDAPATISGPKAHAKKPVQPAMASSANEGMIQAWLRGTASSSNHSSSSSTKVSSGSDEGCASGEVPASSFNSSGFSPSTTVMCERFTMARLYHTSGLQKPLLTIESCGERWVGWPLRSPD